MQLKCYSFVFLRNTVIPEHIEATMCLLLALFTKVSVYFYLLL